MFISSKINNIEEEGDIFLQWVLNQLSDGNAWKFSWYILWEDEKFLENGLVGLYGVIKVLILNVVLLTCGQCVIH